MPVPPAIQTDQLKKVFGERAAVKGLTLQVEQGEVFGFLGPNGAGKTTSIKMLLGLITPTSGAASLLGAPIGDRAARARVGFLPEHFRFQEWLTAGEFLELHGQLLGMGPIDLKWRVAELLDQVGLADFRGKQLNTFSKGMLQRIGLAQALLNHPALVILDEPTSGLDPVGRRLVRDIIHELRGQGTSVFLNSHLLSEIEVTCDRVGFIRHGEVVRVLELASLETERTSVTICAGGLTPETLAGLSRWGEDIHADGERLPQRPHAAGMARGPHAPYEDDKAAWLTLVVRRETDLPELTRYLVAQGADVYQLTPNRMSLEELFIETVGRDGGL